MSYISLVSCLACSLRSVCGTMLSGFQLVVAVAISLVCPNSLSSFSVLQDLISKHVQPRNEDRCHKIFAL